MQLNTFLQEKYIKLTLCLLLLLWLFSSFVGLSIYRQEQAHGSAVFSNEVDEALHRIQSRMLENEQVLLGAKGLFGASKSVDRDEFHAYISSLLLPQRYPGIQVIGYTEWIKRDALVEQVNAVRAEGFPIFSSYPEGERDYYSMVVYLEPFSGSNLIAFGYDMYSEAVRRRAMDSAVINNETTLSGKVRLVQDKGDPAQVGTLMYIPIYKNGSKLDSVADRWQALQGFVYSAYRMNDLMGALNQRENIRDYIFTIYAGEAVASQQLYTSKSHGLRLVQPAYTQTRSLALFGQVWTLVFNSTLFFEREHSSMLSLWTLAFGYSFSVLLSLLFYFLISQRQRALAFVETMTQNVRNKNHELKINQERFELALESSAMGVWSWELANNIIQWDASIFALFGLSEQKDLNTYESFLVHLHHDDRARVFEEVAHAIEGGCGFDTEYRVIWPDGSVHFIASRAKISFGEEGKAVSLIGTCWDVTERKRLDKLKTEFVSTVSHELRTPLTAITGALGLAVSGAIGELPEKIKTALDIAYKNSQRLKLLINDLLDMDKLLAGKLEFHCEPQLLKPLIERAVTENKAYADQYNVQYIVKPVDPSYCINVEEARFLQVMANYLSNAAKFSQKNSSVIVSVSQHENWLRIDVSDTGPGIAADARAHIFEKFYQVDSSDTRKKGGTGLGLAISKEIVERMGGRVGFISEVGVGSTFYAEFPMVS